MPVERPLHEDLRMYGICKRRGDGKVSISVSHCNWCERIMLGKTDQQGGAGMNCPNCGEETHNVSKLVALGEAVDPSTLNETS